MGKSKTAPAPERTTKGVTVNMPTETYLRVMRAADAQGYSLGERVSMGAWINEATTTRLAADAKRLEREGGKK